MNKFITFSFLISIIFFSCSSSTSIDNIEFHYYKPGISTPAQNFCASILFVNSENVRYKKIANKPFLKKIENHLNKLKPSNESVNSRVFALINYKSGNIDTLCIGEYRSLCLNGNFMSNNEDLHNLIMDEIDFYDKKLYDSIYGKK
nr:hypothetical protein [uncultured Psychroserpens sp.]